MQLGDPISEGWTTYRRFWKHLIPISFVTYLVIALLELALAGIGGAVSSLVAFVVSVAGVFLLQAVLVEAVADVRDGVADLTLSQTLARGWRNIGPVVVAGVTAAIAISIGLFLLAIPGLFLLTIWSLIVPAIVVEHRAAFDSFGRSRELVRGHAWTVFGVIFLTGLINAVAFIVLLLVFHGIWSGLGHYLANVISNTLIAPFTAASWTSMYFLLRAIKEPSAAETPSGAAYSES